MGIVADYEEEDASNNCIESRGEGGAAALWYNFGTRSDLETGQDIVDT